MIKKLGLIVNFILILSLLTACTKSITVTIIDNGKENSFDTKTGITVAECLEQADITISTKDEVEPSLDSKLTEDTKKIAVRRYAKVSVRKGQETKTVELHGATVQDAIYKSGFTIEEGEEPDHSLDEYLTDGMTICISKEINVKIESDGETNELKTRAITVEDLLFEQGIELDEDDELSVNKNTLLENGMTITVYRVEYKTETRTEKIEFDTENQSDDSMYEGESSTIQEGKDGEKEVTYKVKYVNGKEDSKELISEKTTKNPTNKIVAIGTKKKTNYTQYLGTWSYVFDNNGQLDNNHALVTSVTFTEINGTTAKFRIFKGNIVAVTEIDATGEIVDGKIQFSYDKDGWLSSGHGTITLNDDSIHLYAVVDSRGSTARITLDCDNDLTR